MPSNVVETEEDEKKWKKAKEKAKKQGKGDDYEYIMGIYKKMNPDGIDKESSLKSPLLKRAKEFEGPDTAVDSEEDEKKWIKAKKKAAEEGHEGDFDYIMEIYKGMNPDGIEKESSLLKIAEDLSHPGGDFDRNSLPLTYHVHNALLRKRKRENPEHDFDKDPEHPIETLDNETLEGLTKHLPEDDQRALDKDLKEWGESEGLSYLTGNGEGD